VKKSFNRKSLLLSLLLLATGSAWAEWVKIPVSGDLYIDPATIRKDGNLRKIWGIRDLEQRDKNGAMSIRTRVEYDCKEERNRVLVISTHTELMAGGTTIESFGESPRGWVEIPPGSTHETILKIVCAQ
jgi:hypothetical protein